MFIVRIWGERGQQYWFNFGADGPTLVSTSGYREPFAKSR